MSAVNRLPTPHSRQAPAARFDLAPDDVLARPVADWDAALIAQRATPAGMPEHELLALLNSGDCARLRQLPGFNQVVAERLISFRTAKGPFVSLDEVIRAPLIGALRFVLLVGRESFVPSRPLHAALRLPFDSFIRVRDLQPLTSPPAPLTRVFLGPEDAFAPELALARATGCHLTCVRVAGAVLFFHHPGATLHSASPLGATLPRALRPLLLARRRQSPTELLR